MLPPRLYGAAALTFSSIINERDITIRSLSREDLFSLIETEGRRRKSSIWPIPLFVFFLSPSTGRISVEMIRRPSQATHQDFFLTACYAGSYLIFSPELWCMKTSDPSAHRSCTPGPAFYTPIKATATRGPTHPHNYIQLPFKRGIYHIWSDEEPTDWWMITSKWCSMARKRSRGPVTSIFGADRLGNVFKWRRRAPRRTNILEVTRWFFRFSFFHPFPLFFL